eukprot:3180358-Pyramimonas_sp.AAC.1
MVQGRLRRPATPGGQKRQLHGADARASHPPRWLSGQKRWYCRIFASSVTEYLSDKMQSECAGKPSCDSMACKLKHWEELADAEHWQRDASQPAG